METGYEERVESGGKNKSRASGRICMVSNLPVTVKLDSCLGSPGYPEAHLRPTPRDSKVIKLQGLLSSRMLKSSPADF